MRIMARDAGVQDGILRCANCDAPVVKVGREMRCVKETEPEELVAAGLIPSRDAAGNFTFDLSTKDQQSIQISQALSRSVEIDNAYLEKLGLNIEKIREHQRKLEVVP